MIIFGRTQTQGEGEYHLHPANAFWVNWGHQRYILAFGFLWFWDYALTFKDEVGVSGAWWWRDPNSQRVVQVEYGWKGRKSWGFVLFLLVSHVTSDVMPPPGD